MKTGCSPAETNSNGGKLKEKWTRIKDLNWRLNSFDIYFLYALKDEPKHLKRTRGDFWNLFEV